MAGNHNDGAQAMHARSPVIPRLAALSALAFLLLYPRFIMADTQDDTEPMSVKKGGDDEEFVKEVPIDEAAAVSERKKEGEEEVLVCEGGWRYPLYETRRELGPARLARLLEIQQDIVLSGRAFHYCQVIMASNSTSTPPLAQGVCEGLLAASQGIERVSHKLFVGAGEHGCLGSGRVSSERCEHLREQLPTLRRYQRVSVQRATLVASVEVCASEDRKTNRALRNSCLSLERKIDEEADQRSPHPGRFALSAPLPESVAGSVELVREASDGHFLNLVPEDYLGVRERICETGPAIAPSDPWGRRWSKVRHSLCAELSLAANNAATCRRADLYIDERGELHLGRSLASRRVRRQATLCIDVSDFDGDHPLMVTLGLNPTSSVPERVWPGETVAVGHWIDQVSGAQDVLQLSVFGKARGVSLKEVLRINGVDFKGDHSGPANSEACRIARSWVPVVDHEVPVGPRATQAVIPVDFGRGRDGETTKIEQGDHILVWVREIEPAGAVLVEYADGQSVGYEPPPLLGRSGDPTTFAAKPRQHIRGAASSVAEPLLPRRARYPGSRVLRLGYPTGNSQYKLRICIRHRVGASEAAETGRVCDVESVIVDEKIYVHGSSHLGVQLHVGYSFFGTTGLRAKRTAAAQAAGEDLFEIVEESNGSTEQDIAILLAVYPFGRDPLDFSYRPWSSSYWRHASLVCGFSLKKISFWEDLYLGASLPIANGISTSVLAHFGRRDVLSQTSRGQFLSVPDAGATLELEDYVPTHSTLSMGVGIGISFDLDLFQRAFTGVWHRIAGADAQFYSSGLGS